ncbi:MAG: hypothetical protein MI748_12195, partial [Opitutales bacterium]|nr:hypothetical protein [Opitutales bacterium]
MDLFGGSPIVHDVVFRNNTQSAVHILDTLPGDVYHISNCTFEGNANLGLLTFINGGGISARGERDNERLIIEGYVCIHS